LQFKKKQKRKNAPPDLCFFPCLSSGWVLFFYFSPGRSIACWTIKKQTFEAIAAIAAINIADLLPACRPITAMDLDSDDAAVGAATSA
jgi:hypothetical protein